MAVSRRGLLTGVVTLGVVGVVGGGVEAVRTHPDAKRWLRDLVRDPAHHDDVPTNSAAHKVSGSFHSAAMGKTVGWSIAYPKGSAVGSAALPVCLAMAGRGSDHHSPFTGVYLDRFLNQVVEAGTPPFAIVTVDGGDHAYWHPRSYGEDPPQMVRNELFPMLRGKGLLVDRLGLFGWSMGGFGAIIMAETFPKGSVKAVAASSPALWHKASQTPEGAFDSAEDFKRYDAFGLRGNLAGIPVRIACGDDDPFYDAARDFAHGLPSLAARTSAAAGTTTSSGAMWRRAS